MAGGEVAGALIFILGVAFGRVMRVRGRKEYKPKEIKPFCGCGHHFSLHDPSSKECNGSFDGWDEPINRAAGKASIRACGCRQYAGPTPLPEYYAPEIGSTA